MCCNRERGFSGISRVALACAALLAVGCRETEIASGADPKAGADRTDAERPAADVSPRPEWRIEPAPNDPLPALLRAAAAAELARQRKLDLGGTDWAEPELPLPEEPVRPDWRRVPSAPDVVVRRVEPLYAKRPVIETGDRLEVRVETPLREFDGSYIVEPSGEIRLRCRCGGGEVPGPAVRVEGLTLGEADEAIGEKLKDFFRSGAAPVAVSRAGAGPDAGIGPDAGTE